jgi:hypothetical protein
MGPLHTSPGKGTMMSEDSLVKQAVAKPDSTEGSAV